METFTETEGTPRREDILEDIERDVFPNPNHRRAPIFTPNNHHRRAWICVALLSLLPIAIGLGMFCGGMYLWSLDRKGLGTCTLPVLVLDGAAPYSLAACESAERSWSHHSEDDAFVVPIVENAIFRVRDSDDNSEATTSEDSSTSHSDIDSDSQSCNFVVIGNEDQYGSNKRREWCYDWHEAHAGMTIPCWCCGSDLEGASFYHSYFDHYAPSYPGDYCLPENPGTWAAIGAWVLFVLSIGLIVCGCGGICITFVGYKQPVVDNHETSVSERSASDRIDHHPALEGFRESLRREDILEEIARDAVLNPNHRRAPIFTPKSPSHVSRKDLIEASLDAMILEQGASLNAQLSTLPMYASRKTEKQNKNDDDNNGNDENDDNDDESLVEAGNHSGQKGMHTCINISSISIKSNIKSVDTNATHEVDDCCPICLEEYKMGETVCWSKAKKCNHIFHHSCITLWLKDHSDCPFCRYAIIK